jgi:hypothetical protein
VQHRSRLRSINDFDPASIVKDKGLFQNIDDVIGERGTTLVGWSESSYKLSRYWKYIAEYTRRKLSFPSDSLNPSLGILAAFKSKQPKQPRIYHICGLPVVKIEAFHVQTTSMGSALSWRHAGSRSGKKDFPRREGFPSWSWAGWEGQVSGPWRWFN